jgi:uncharacterized protein (UPF0303 family)
MPIADDLVQIAIQENTLQFQSFTEDDAWRLGCRLRDASADRHFPVVIEIRRSGHPLFVAALPGSTPDNVDWARRKASVVARFHRSSYAMGLELQQKNTTLSDRFGLTLADYAAHGGSFPLRVAGLGVIGSATVSGLPQREDHEFVVEMLCAHLQQSYDKLRLP